MGLIGREGGSMTEDNWFLGGAGGRRREGGIPDQAARVGKSDGSVSLE